MQPPVWVVLVPAPPERVAPWLEEVRAAAPQDETDDWEVVGTRAGTAVLCRTPGTEGGLDVDLAEHLSRRAHAATLVWPQTDGVLDYEAGDRRRPTRPAAAHLAEHGLDGPDAPAVGVVLPSVLLVPGHPAADVARRFPPDGPVTVSDAPAGAVVRHAEGLAGVLGPWLSAALGADVVRVGREPDGSVSADLYRGGELAGRLGAPTPANEHAPPLHEIAGFTDADELARAVHPDAG